VRKNSIRMSRDSSSFGWLALALLLLSPTVSLRAQDDATQVVDSDASPYHQALLNYKSGHYDAALTAINAAEQAKPGDPATEILKARILTEQHDFASAAKVLEHLNSKPGLTPVQDEARTLAFGDLMLRQRRFDEAAKFYESLLANKPGDPDLILKLVYTRVSTSDFITAGKYASQLKPFDPALDPLDAKHPGNPSYYFAKAALAQATGKSQEAENDIQTVRTLYGITIANRYLKTFYEVFATEQSPAARAEPPDTNTAPASPKP